MKGALLTVLLSSLAAICLAAEFELVCSPMLDGTSVNRYQSDDDAKSQKCNGMYGKGSWGGSVDPFILVKIEKPDNLANPDAITSLVIFEWHDETLIGMTQDGSKNVRPKPTTHKRRLIDEG